MSRTEESSSFRDFWRTSRLYFGMVKHLVTLRFQRKIELREPQQLLRQKFGDDLEVLGFSTEPLVKWGDNYGSTIVKAVVEIKKEGQIEKLQLVAKMLPSSKFVRENMQCDICLTKEIFLYEEIILAYQKLYSSEFDIVPKFYGGRLAIDSDTGVDDGALLLLENLKESGYVMEDRLKGLTWSHLKIAVPAIAKFHAIGLAMKQKNPAFYSEVKNYAKTFEIPPQFINMFITKLMKMIKSSGELNCYYERVKSLNKFDSNGNFLMFEEFDPDHPWACLVHRDLWINNVMFHSQDGIVDRFKFFDFQVYGISSPMTDLLLFLFTSLPRDLVDFDEAVRLYRETMCDVLKELECDSSLFEEESFDKRLKEDAKIELYHCLMMARNIEMRSAWDVIKLSANTTQRMKNILDIYDVKGWFDD